MGAFKKTFVVIILPFAGWFVSNSLYEVLYGDIGVLFRMPLIGYIFYLAMIFSMAILALLWSRIIYPRYLKKFDESYKERWNVSRAVIVLSILISYVVIGLNFEWCGYLGSTCRGFLDAVYVFYANYAAGRSYIFTPQGALATVGVFLGLLGSLSIILKELIPRAVFYWKTRK